MTGIIKKFLLNIVALWKSFGGDMFFVYKNILHWNISKIIMILSVFVLIGIGALLFALIIFLIISTLGGGMEAFSTEISQIFNPLSPYFLDFSIAIVLVLLFIGIASVLGGLMFLYIRVLFAKLNLEYVSGNRLAYKGNNYFSLKLFYKHLCLTLLGIIIICAPIVIGIVIMVVIISLIELDPTQIFEGITDRPIIQWSSLLIAIFMSGITIYLGYRMTFIHLLLVEDPQKKVLEIIKKSFTLTKSKLTFLTFIIFTLPIILILFIWNGFIEGNSSRLERINDYVVLENTKNREGENFELETKDFYYYEDLSLAYGEMSQNDLRDEYEALSFYANIYWIVNFIFFFGIFELMVTGFYKRRLY